MLASLNYIQENKSKADDAGTESRDSIFFATRTINSLQGGTEQNTKTMIAAIMGMNSHISSEKFCYIFVKDKVAYIEKKFEEIKDDDDEYIADTSCNENDGKLIQEECYLDEIDKISSAIDNEESESLESKMSTGARMIPVEEGKVVFLSQLESYIHRGPSFENYSPIEYECIVDIQKLTEDDTSKDDKKKENCNKNDETNKEIIVEKKKITRKKRVAHDLGKDHPLAKYNYKGYIRTKFCTPIFPSIPSCPRECFDVFGEGEEEKGKAKKMNNLSKYLLAAFVPWSLKLDGSIEMEFEFSNKGLLELLKKWDNSNASEINKQRFRSISTILKRKQYSNWNKQCLANWRQRNTDWWFETEKIKNNNIFSKHKECNKKECNTNKDESEEIEETDRK